MFYLQILSHKVIVSVHAQSTTSPQRSLPPLPPSPSVFPCLVCDISVWKDNKSHVLISTRGSLYAQREWLRRFPPFTFSNPLLVFPVNTDCIWITSQIGLDQILPYTVRAFLQHKRHVFSWMKCKQCIKWQLNTHSLEPFVWWLTKMSSVGVRLG